MFLIIFKTEQKISSLILKLINFSAKFYFVGGKFVMNFYEFMPIFGISLNFYEFLSIIASNKFP